MAKFYKDRNGDYGLRWGGPLTADEPIPYGAEIVEFDEETNADLIAALCGRIPGVLWQDHAIERGQITHKGEPIAINPPASVKPTTDERVAALLEWADKFRGALDTAETLDALKLQDRQHPKLPEKVTAEIAELSEAKA